MKTPLLSIAQVAVRLNVCDDTVRALIKRRTLAAVKVAGVWRIDADDLDAYLAAQRTTAPVVHTRSELPRLEHNPFA